MPYLLLTILNIGKPTIVITTNSPKATSKADNTKGNPTNLYSIHPIIKAFIIVGHIDAINKVYLLLPKSLGVKYTKIQLINVANVPNIMSGTP